MVMECVGDIYTFWAYGIELNQSNGWLCWYAEHMLQFKSVLVGIHVKIVHIIVQIFTTQAYRW